MENIFLYPGSDSMFAKWKKMDEDVDSFKTLVSRSGQGHECY